MSSVSKPLARLLQALDLRANSLIITVFGDAIVPRGGNIWLGSLISLLAPFGLSERLVRTGVYRLSQEGWLQSEGRGRRSYYSLTDTGSSKFADADRRIYASEPPQWDRKWRLLQILPNVDQTKRQSLRRELRWMGFGQLSPTLLAHPTAGDVLVRTILDELDMGGDVFVFTAELADMIDAQTVSATAAIAWELDDLKSEYGTFINKFKLFKDDPDSFSELSAADCFALRALLIHDYRRILLKDPLLPQALLPHDWNGSEARSLCAWLYGRVADRGDEHLVSIMETLNGTIPALTPDYEGRFGGVFQT